MKQPMDFGLPLEDSILEGESGGTFACRVEYICQQSACAHCGECEKHCPTNAIYYHGHCPVFDLILCIDCGQCKEHCPTKAILRTVQMTSD